MNQSRYVTPHFLHQFLRIEREENESREDTGIEPLIVGIGGSGSNIVHQISDQIQATIVASNTDARHLRSIQSDNKLLLGLDVTYGEGTGNQPTMGQSAAISQRNEIQEIYKDKELVFLVTGLGGGTGTGATPVFAEIAKRRNLFTIAICTFPFKMEGKRKQNTAFQGLDILEETCDMVILLPNDNLEGLSEVPIQMAFNQIDNIISKLVQVLTKCLDTSTKDKILGDETIVDLIYDQITGREFGRLEHMQWELEETSDTVKFYLLPSEIPLIPA